MQSDKNATVYKRIRVVESESEGESPMKKVVLELDSATKERRLKNMVHMFPDISALVRWKITYLFIYCYL